MIVYKLAWEAALQPESAAGERHFYVVNGAYRPLSFYNCEIIFIYFESRLALCTMRMSLPDYCQTFHSLTNFSKSADGMGRLKK